MAKYTLEWVEKKNNDWIMASLVSGEKEVSINRISKKGEVFPNFDNLAPGTEVEGELWQSQVGKWYLFPPRANPMYPRPAGLGASKTAGIAKAMDRKEASIAQFQSSKEDAIKMAGAMRDSTLITLAELAGSPLVAEDFKQRWEYWRSWLLQKASDPF